MDNIEEILTGDFAIVNAAVLHHVPEFAAKKLTLAKVVRHNSEVLDSISLHFIDHQTAMEMRLSFFSAPKGHNGGFNVMIINSASRRLMVADYLKNHGRMDFKEISRYRDPNANLQQFAHVFLGTLVELLDKELKPILDGETFEETPIDWQGYK